MWEVYPYLGLGLVVEQPRLLIRVLQVLSRRSDDSKRVSHHVGYTRGAVLLDQSWWDQRLRTMMARPWESARTAYRPVTSQEKADTWPSGLRLPRDTSRLCAAAGGGRQYMMTSTTEDLKTHGSRPPSEG